MDSLIVFAILYAIMFSYNLRRATQSPTQVLILLSLFCGIRVAAFIMRIIFELPIYEPVDSLSITMDIFFDVGFFALLYSAYVLVLDREIASGNVVRNSISRVTSNRYLICFALAVAVAVGIARFVCGSQGNTSTLALEETYLIIPLAVIVLMGVQTVFQVNAERAALKRGTPSGKIRYQTYIPCLIIILLLIHQIYSIVSINVHTYRQASPLWWTLWALPELLAVFLFVAPDVVPNSKRPAPCPHGPHTGPFSVWRDVLGAVWTP